MQTQATITLSDNFGGDHTLYLPQEGDPEDVLLAMCEAIPHMDYPTQVSNFSARDFGVRLRSVLGGDIERVAEIAPPAPDLVLWHYRVEPRNGHKPGVACGGQLIVTVYGRAASDGTGQRPLIPADKFLVEQYRYRPIGLTEADRLATHGRRIPAVTQVRLHLLGRESPPIIGDRLGKARRSPAYRDGALALEGAVAWLEAERGRSQPRAIEALRERAIRLHRRAG